MTTENLEKSNTEMSLKELLLNFRTWFKYLLSKWVIILVFGITGGAMGVIYALFQKPTYIAETSFVLEEDNGTKGLGSIAGVASMAGFDIGGGGGIFQGDNILELYKSRTMIVKALLSPLNDNPNEFLIDRFIKFKKLRKEWDTKPKLKNITFHLKYGEIFSRTQDSILISIANEINHKHLNVIKADKKSSIIKATVRCGDEVFAKAFNDEIVKNVNDFYFQTKTRKGAENVKILEQKVDSVQKMMYGSIYTAASVADATPNLNPTRQVQRTAPIQRSQFSIETNKAMLSELIKNLELSRISLRKEAPLIQIVDNPIYPLEKDQFGKTKGLILGGLLAGFIIVVLLILQKLFKNIFSE